jgi:hypothetical protein
MDEWNARENIAPECDNVITPKPLEEIADDMSIDPLIQFSLKTLRQKTRNGRATYPTAKSPKQKKKKNSKLKTCILYMESHQTLWWDCG